MVDLNILIQLAFSLLKVIFYIYIRYITAVVFVINLMAYWEAYTLIKTPAYRCGSGTYTSRAIYPPIVREVGGDIPLSELLYKKYKLFVFNLSYNKVLYGRFFFLKHLTIYQVVRLICMYIIGVNRLTLFIITTMLMI